MPETRSRLDSFISEALDRQGMTIRAFAQRVQVSHVFVIQVKRGGSLFPPEHFQRWCEVLSLTPAQRDEFLRLTLLARSPPEIQALVASLEQRIVALTSALPPDVANEPRP